MLRWYWFDRLPREWRDVVNEYGNVGEAYEAWLEGRPLSHFKQQMQDERDWRQRDLLEDLADGF